MGLFHHCVPDPQGGEEGGWLAQRQLMSVKIRNLGDEHFSVALIYRIMFS